MHGVLYLFHFRFAATKAERTASPNHLKKGNQSMPKLPNTRDSVPREFNPETAPPRLSIDWEAYLPFFEDEDISDEEKRELIEALWSIMVSFVDLGFGIHPVQQHCGKDVSLADLPVVDVLNLDITKRPTEQPETQPQGGQTERSPHVPE